MFSDKRWLWLLTGVPALLVFALPQSAQSQSLFGPLLIILEIGFVAQVAQSMVRIKHETGAIVPFNERLALIPIAAGVLFYALFASNEIDHHLVRPIGLAVVGMIALAKIALLRSRIRPLGTPSL